MIPQDCEDASGKWWHGELGRDGVAEATTAGRKKRSPGTLAEAVSSKSVARSYFFFLALLLVVFLAGFFLAMVTSFPGVRGLSHGG